MNPALPPGTVGPYDRHCEGCGKRTRSSGATFRTWLTTSYNEVGHFYACTYRCLAMACLRRYPLRKPRATP